MYPYSLEKISNTDLAQNLKTLPAGGGASSLAKEEGIAGKGCLGNYAATEAMREGGREKKGRVL